MGFNLKTLNVIYWSRVLFGILAGLISTFVVDVNEGNPLVSGISIGLLFYIITYYFLKYRYITKVEKPSKIFTMGIGAYFLTWIAAWVLLLTLTGRVNTA